jgi:spermidine synthase
MSWLYERHILHSEKNGEITCIRSFGRWSVLVRGYTESAPYMVRLWNHFLKKIPGTVQSVLILGFGAGGNVKQLHKCFPRAAITAIEWDPVMVEIAERVHVYPSKWRPQILIGDASRILPTMTETFDLILFDLYIGNEIMGIRDPQFSRELARLLSPNGWLLVNASTAPEVFKIVQTEFALQESWIYRYNHLAIFRRYTKSKK